MKYKILKPILFVLGVLTFILGALGILLPLLPATPFFLLSAWFFFNSSRKAHAWLFRQPVIGQLLTDWQKSGAISKRNKTYAILMILTSIVFVFLKDLQIVVKGLLILIMTIVVIFIATRPDK